MKKREYEMFTLSDINRVTNSHDGDIYSDLYKDVNGFRPRDALCQFASIEEFDKDLERLSKCLSEQLDEESAEQAVRWSEFLNRVEMVKQTVVNCDTAHAVEIIADTEGCDAEERSYYGWESLEYQLGLSYDSIKNFLENIDA